MLKLNIVSNAATNEESIIQIQHLLKLNKKISGFSIDLSTIQIQHLLKLNGTDKNTMISQENSNTTLVKVKLVRPKSPSPIAPSIQIQHLLKLNIEM